MQQAFIANHEWEDKDQRPSRETKECSIKSNLVVPLSIVISPSFMRCLQGGMEYFLICTACCAGCHWYKFMRDMEQIGSVCNAEVVMAAIWDEKPSLLWVLWVSCSVHLTHLKDCRWQIGQIRLCSKLPSIPSVNHNCEAQEYSKGKALNASFSCMDDPWGEAACAAVPYFYTPPLRRWTGGISDDPMQYTAVCWSPGSNWQQRVYLIDWDELSQGGYCYYCWTGKVWKVSGDHIVCNLRWLLCGELQLALCIRINSHQSSARLMDN